MSDGVERPNIFTDDTAVDYDIVVDWKARLGRELPFFRELFEGMRDAVFESEAFRARRQAIDESFAEVQRGVLEPIAEADRLINVPVVKHHSLDTTLIELDIEGAGKKKGEKVRTLVVEVQDLEADFTLDQRVINAIASSRPTHTSIRTVLSAVIRM